MDYTTTYGIDNSAPVTVRCHVDGARRITVQENFNSATAPTCDLVMVGGAPGSSAVNISKGTPAVFTSPDGGYRYNEAAGTIQTASGSCTVMQLESTRL